MDLNKIAVARAVEEIETLRDKVRDLETVLTVMDVTLFCLMSNVQTDPLWMGQVRAAAEAYKHATGEESMLVENRCKKDFTKGLEESDD